MKNLLILTLLFFSFSILSQETYTMKSGGRVFNSKEEKLNPDKVREEFSGEALNLYNSGRNKKTVGNLFLYTGIITSPIAISAFLNDAPRGTVYTTAGITLTCLLVSIPIKTGYSKKIKKSVELMNGINSSSSTSFNIENTSVVINQNGAGFRITF